MDRWRGHVAIVTGASSGIGLRLVERLLSEGLLVAGLARRLELMKPRQGFLPIRCDVSKEDQVLEAFRRVERELGPVRLLVNSAGVLYPDTILDSNADNLSETLEVNVLGATLCAREALRSMMRQQIDNPLFFGHIVNINSLAGHNAALVRQPVGLYCASKYALTGLCESLRVEVAAKKARIKITSISPGGVKTEMIQRAGVPDELMETAPLLSPDDVCDAIIYALGTPEKVQVNELMISCLDYATESDVEKTKDSNTVNAI
ncbi:hypothetical protein QAD02_009003 [Eretmocerus hayati]|uniref:Uncharacterized protein n=1 Tax=Eretmocerus hayati TaxID=131215 RepID=A0ACC2N8E8_9HYME|nr:hypothetical protein QAD02_009003 [Eretmocerus hayati]